MTTHTSEIANEIAGLIIFDYSEKALDAMNDEELSRTIQEIINDKIIDEPELETLDRSFWNDITNIVIKKVDIYLTNIRE